MNPFFRAIYALTGRGAVAGARVPSTPSSPQRKLAQRKHSSRGRRHEVAIGGFGKQAFPISLWAGPHDPLLAQRVTGLPQRRCNGGRTTNIPAAIRLGLSMLKQRPWAEKSVVVITDGHSNEEYDQLPVAIESARRAGVTIHSVAMGRGFDGKQLGDICHPTGGKVILVSDLRNLANALTEVGRAVVNQARGRPSAMVILVDYSASMDEDAAGMTKLQRTSEAVSHLLRWFIANHA